LLGAKANELETTLVDFFKDCLSFTFFPIDPKACIHQTPFARLDLMAAHADLNDLIYRLECLSPYVPGHFNRLPGFEVVL
jgi:chromosome partitioning protein